VKINSLQPTLSLANKLSRFKGFYCMAGMVIKFNQCGEPYWVITLMDAFSHIMVNVAHKECALDRMSPYGFVHLEASRVKSRGEQYFVADYIYGVDEIPEKYRNVNLIPKAAAANAQDVLRLIQIVENIVYPELKHFVNSTLMQGRIMLPFLRNPASLNHHHNYVGGLLRHSVGVAELITDRGQGRREEKALGIVGALLHDLGKTQTLSASMMYTATGTLVNHDFLTLELCAAALETLSKHNPHYANILRHIWTCNKGRYAYISKLDIATQVQRFDRSDAGNYT
jgi:3'-5' exoribonuclease